MLEQSRISKKVKTFLLWKKSKIMELVGCMVADITVIVTNGQSSPVNVVVNSIGHLFLLGTSINRYNL